jgi:hypothetical protein
MDNLRKVIKIYFKSVDPDKILNEEIISDSNSVKKCVWDMIAFKKAAYAQHAFDYNTEDEINNLYRKVSEDWRFSPYKNNGKESVFYLLSHFTKQVLIDEGQEPFVVYEHLLKWRDLTFELGEDIFSSSYLAYCDVISNRDRHFFSWRPILFSNNKRLRNILEKGVAENHSHLYASSLNFDVGWISLMNKFNLNRASLEKIVKQNRLSGKTVYEFNSEKVDFLVTMQKALVIRLLLFEAIEFYNDKSITVDLKTYLEDKLDFKIIHLMDKSNIVDSLQLNLNFEKVLNHISYLGNEKALKIDHKGIKEFFDYAALANMHSENINGCYFLFGERYILYNTFKNLYRKLEGKLDVKLLESLLHSYLLMKNTFRGEMVQLNRRYGFGNFKAFQDRKYSLIGNNTIYDAFFLNITLNYNRELMNIKSHELRIAPGNKISELKLHLDKIVEVRESEKIQSNFKKTELKGEGLINRLLSKSNIKSSDELCIVLHFLKRKDNLFQTRLHADRDLLYRQEIFERDSYLRKIIKKQAQTIVRFRDECPARAVKIRGIDAASSEIASRPEAFGQAFRYLKHHTIKQNNPFIKGLRNLKPLSITFHAGEDFFDVVDGIRYIDECLYFLGMGQGDRLGHALAIGIDVQSYYKLKSNKIMMPKHMVLDNMVWLLAKAKEFGLIEHIAELAKLENTFKHLYSEIYLNSQVDQDLRSISYHDYFDSWKLRGDDPKIYFKLFTENKNIVGYFNDLINIDYWERCRLNDCDYKLKQLRNRREVVRLYYEYHYNPQVKNIGNEIKQFEITDSYTKLVMAIQKRMMGIISSKNISIETNPSSNYLIGPINRYDEHPISKWYNLGLECDSSTIKDLPQISVSMNTDDAGIFCTTIENEYALMAIALEKQKDENGDPRYNKSMIYDWVERVRQMGLEQSFNT